MFDLKEFEEEYTSSIKSVTKNINRLYSKILQGEIMVNLKELSKLTNVTEIIMGNGTWWLKTDYEIEVIGENLSDIYTTGINDLINPRCCDRSCLVKPEILIPSDKLTEMLN